MGKSIVIAEKPDQAREYAKFLGGGVTKNGYIQLHNGNVVGWCIGHLLASLKPGELDPKWEKWNKESLPILPAEMKKVPVANKSSHFSTLVNLIRECDEVIIATDAGREGELIAREVLTAARFKGQIKRLWSSTQADADLRKAFDNLKDGRETENLHEAALAREWADYCYGLSLTRAATLQLPRSSNNAWAVGRVKTPTMWIALQRRKAIENFVEKDFYELVATVQRANGETFEMRHAPGTENRITTKAEAERLIAKALKAQGPLKVERTGCKEKPPGLYNQSRLGVAAERKWGYTPADTLGLHQKVYELKALSYPRSDANTLATAQIAEVGNVLKALRQYFPDLMEHFDKITEGRPVIRKSVFDDAGVTDHSAFSPTVQYVPSLNSDQLALLRMVALRYLENLSPDQLYDQTTVELDANGVLFRASSRIITNPGWSALARD